MNDETDGNTSSIIKDNVKSERGNDLNAQSKPMKQKFQHQKSATEQCLSMILSHAEHKCIVGKDSIGVKNHSKYEISTIKQGHQTDDYSDSNTDDSLFQSKSSDN